jgi:hypothetical protein
MLRGIDWVVYAKPSADRSRSSPTSGATELATATCGSIRLKLLKIGALVTRSVRRIRVALTSSCPDAAAVRAAHARLCG